MNDGYVEPTILDISLIEKNIQNFSSQKLCDMIVCDRYFNIEKKISNFCMEELARRRINGDNFDFENYIDITYCELPQLNFSNLDLRTILNQVIKNKK